MFRDKIERGCTDLGDTHPLNTKPISLHNIYYRIKRLYQLVRNRLMMIEKSF